MTMWERNFSLAFVNVMDRIITIIVLLFLHLHLFVLIFDKLKTGPRPTLFRVNFY